MSDEEMQRNQQEDEESMEDYTLADAEVEETEQEIKVRVQMPEVGQDDIKMDVRDGELDIQVDTGREKLYTSIPLPQDADTGQMEALHTGEALEIRIRRAQA